MNKEEELKKLKGKVEKKLNCELKRKAHNLVFGSGNPEAEVMLIGEAPGEQEDLKGIPFVGRAGKKLDLYLKEIGLKREDIYIANILKYRPPKNRDPTIEEIKKHTPFLIEQIKIIQPKIIVTFGNYSSKFTISGFNPEKMNKVSGITKIHGKLFKINSKDLTILVLPIYHPAATLYNPKLKEDFKKDFKILEMLFKNNFEIKTKKKEKELTNFFN